MSEDEFSPYEILSVHIRREIGHLIRLAREEKGMSQAELADKVQRRQAYISDLETGKSEASVTTLYMLSEVLSKPALYFLPEEFRDHKRDIIKVEELSVEEAKLISSIRELEPEGYLGPSYYLVAMKILEALIELQKSEEREWQIRSRSEK